MISVSLVQDAPGRNIVAKIACRARGRQNRDERRQRAGPLAEGNGIGDVVGLDGTRPFGIGDNTLSDGARDVKSEMGAAAVVIDKELRAELFDIDVERHFRTIGGIGAIEIETEAR